MSIQQTEKGIEQELPPPASPPLHAQDMVQVEQVFPRSPWQPPPGPRGNRWIVVGAVILALALMLSLGILLIPGVLQRPSSQVTPTATQPATATTVPTTPVAPTTPGTNVTPTPPAVTPSPQATPPGVSDPAYWDKILGTKPGTSKVESVSIANVMNTPAQQALILVRYTGTDARLDVYIFTNITSAHPKQVFKLAGLVKGDAQISGYSTIMTAEVDKNSSLNTGKPGAKLTADLFREFAWSDGTDKFVQVAFPGLYPDLTRYQAEADQARINQGQDSWKNNAARVAKALAVQFFGWKRTLSTKVLSGGGLSDVEAIVQVQEAPLQNGQGPRPSVIVTLNRLEGNTHNMWVAIGVKDATALTLTNLQPRSLVASPVKLEGKGNAFENTIGMASILDHLYTKVGQALVTGNTDVGMANVPYSIQVSYDTSFKTGPQEGIVEVLLNTPIEANPYAAVMVKVLLNPQPRVAQGPVSCPVAQQVPGYWETVLGIDPNTGGVGTVSCGNLKGDSSLQALVPVYSTTGEPGEVYVYDHITAAHPVLLFKPPTQGALISGASTIMTADIDPNSSLNTGKNADQMTQDLFREFQWSKNAGTFIQVAFPGLYPDLTRWQAEQDQLAVNRGQDTWKNDAVKVAKALVVQFFGWKQTLVTKVLSGGGSRDVNATVQVQEILAQGPPQQGPSVIVTLSRLGGNTHNMWVAIGVKDGTLLTLTNIQPRQHVASPVKLEGKGSAFENVIGMAYILDHLYTPVGRAMVTGVPGLGMGVSPYSVQVSYDTSFKQGPQEGIVEVQMTSPIGDAPAILVKVLLDPQPRIVQGPVSCPIALQDPEYWQSNFGISAGTVTCGNLKGDPSLQALVPVLPTGGEPGHIYVFDRLADAHPVQIFSMQTQSALISGTSTIMTADIDPNSSLNTGKSTDQMTLDLFREFQWSGKAGTFVQVVFPGIFPDLTRWQAEVDQAAVSLGHDSWKRDAVKTAQHFVAQFLPSPASNPPKLVLVSGDGPGDLNAQVNVSFPKSSGSIHPVTKVRLSRLGGNTNGIWEVTAVTADWIAITSPQSGKSTLISSPVTVSGFGSAFEGQIGVVQVLDHLYQQIGWAQALGTEGSKAPPFTVTFPYTSSFQDGAQEGIVVLRHTGGAPFDYGVVIVKVLISA